MILQCLLSSARSFMVLFIALNINGFVCTSAYTFIMAFSCQSYPSSFPAFLSFICGSAKLLSSKPRSATLLSPPKKHLNDSSM